jgi:hypothetical protein
VTLHLQGGRKKGRRGERKRSQQINKPVTTMRSLTSLNSLALKDFNRIDIWGEGEGEGEGEKMIHR